MDLDNFKGNNLRERMIVVLKSNPDYKFSYDELAEILDIHKEKVKKQVYDLKKDGIVKVYEQEEMYDKVYVRWNAYL